MSKSSGGSPHVQLASIIQAMFPATGKQPIDTGHTPSTVCVQKTTTVTRRAVQPESCMILPRLPQACTSSTADVTREVAS